MGAQEEKGACRVQSPRPPALAPPLPGCQPGATPRMPSSGGWHGPGWAGIPPARPGMDLPQPHPTATPALFPGPVARSPQPSSHLPLLGCRLLGAGGGRGGGACSLRLGWVEDLGREASAQRQSPPVIKSSARWHHACPPSQRRDTPAHTSWTPQPSQPPVLGPGSLSPLCRGQGCPPPPTLPFWAASSSATDLQVTTAKAPLPQCTYLFSRLAEHLKALVPGLLTLQPEESEPLPSPPP